jgi:dihydroorotate dehydrogenase electron transfer subunit
MPFEVLAPIVAHQTVGDRVYRMVLHAPDIASSAQPGQFVQMLYSDTYGPPMRRPFSIHDSDTERGTCEIIYAARGTFTRGLARLAVGTDVSLVGPLGNSFQLVDAETRIHVAVAGGVGAPPLHFFLKHILKRVPSSRVQAVLGARSKSLLVVPEDFQRLGLEPLVATDDGSWGIHGTVLEALEHLRLVPERTAVYGCGPEPMLEALGAFCMARDIPCRLSLETVMPCGTGVCMGCVVKVRSDEEPGGFAYVRACHEGPVFDARDLIWT